MSKTPYIIVGSIIALIALVFFTFFERRSVPDVNWNVSYDFTDKEPNGLYVFSHIVERYFGDMELIISDTIPDQSDLGKTLIILFDKNNYSVTSVAEEVFSYADKGADVLLIPKRNPTILLDSLDYNYEQYWSSYDTVNISFLSHAVDHDTAYQFVIYDREFDAGAYIYLNGFKHTWDDNPEYLIAQTQDSNFVYSSFEYGSGTIDMHLFQSLFFNKSYRSNDAFAYTERVLSRYSPDRIYLATIGTSKLSEDEARNPLQFIMSNKPLKAAYLLFMATLLIYAILGGKRKQKTIPILKEKKNTSLEYIDTVSQLFHQQNQHEKLVPHMAEVFYHTMQKKFFVSPEQPDYIKVLAKKSKIAEDQLNYVINRFKNHEDEFSFSEDQLVSLYQRLNNIYKHIDTKKSK